MKKITLLFTILISVAAIQISFAAPSLTITKPPVTPIPSWTGPGAPPLPPPGDPDAIYGQWFVDRASGTIYTNRTHEFYDNVIGSGGGYQSCTAIFGFVSAMTGGGGAPITAFSIDATIHNDIPADTPWAAGNNSHGEQRAYTNQQDQLISGTLLDVKLTAEFSVDPTPPPPIIFPPTWTPPYFDPYPGVYIEAVNHDELAWYCWTDDPQSPDPGNPGNFYVPTWDFGDIPMGGSASKTMSFQIQAPGLPATDPRYHVITGSFFYLRDVLINRTTSLKISDWIEDINFDTCAPYPDQVERSSDVSVFHLIPEPGIFAGITIILLGLFRKIRK